MEAVGTGTTRLDVWSQAVEMLCYDPEVRGSFDPTTREVFAPPKRLLATKPAATANLFVEWDRGPEFRGSVPNLVVARR
jgi:hypothetical protein